MVLKRIFILDYKVDKHFLEQLPFKDFITIRPENLKAAYVPKDAVTIIPQLFEVFKMKIFFFAGMNLRRFAEG